MNWLLGLLEGMSSGLRVTESALYRYPHRTAAQAFRGDEKRVARDMITVMEKYHGE